MIVKKENNKMGKKVGVITFHNYDNYGAILQSYGLQRKLKELGTEPQIIDYRCSYISNPFKLVNLKEKGLFNYIYGAIGHICYIPRRSECNKFRKHMKYGEPVDKSNVKKVGDKYDIYIAGSDQIWDYKLTNFDTTYFLDFVAEGKKKISYAASIGEHLPPKEYQEQYKKLLSDFDEILVRENYGADVVEKLIGTRPECTCDPTLLLTADEWKELLVEPKRKDKYILVYQLGINKEIVNFVKRLKKKTGLKVVYIPFPLVGLLRTSIQLTVGPARWMGFFKNAEYVVTDSFHGVVFSLLFNRKFFTKVNGHHTNRRVEQLLKKIKLTDRTMDSVKSDEDLLKEIDFTYANSQIEQMRKESLEHLKRVIG